MSLIEEIYKYFRLAIAQIHIDQELKPVILQLREDDKMVVFNKSKAQKCNQIQPTIAYEEL